MEYFDWFFSILTMMGEAAVFALLGSIITMAVGFSTVTIPLSINENWGPKYASDKVISNTLLLGFVGGFFWFLMVASNYSVSTLMLGSLGLCLALIAVALLIAALAWLGRQ